ncbi:MAG TPA: DUF1622 domain-containing protein [Steroidobacteraceae bacterium]|nr:DUF1622 domain-containing protein [Steroidobacteraceae bacterium]
MQTFTGIVELVGKIIDGVGVLVVVLGLSVAAFRSVLFRRNTADPYRQFRQDIGRGILLGLEFLVAADIIRTVAVTPTLEGVLVLGLIVLIRTFLSMALEVELEGRWPWQPKSGASAYESPVPLE